MVVVASDTDGGRQWSSAGLPGLDASTILLTGLAGWFGARALPQTAIASALAPDRRVELAGRGRRVGPSIQIGFAFSHCSRGFREGGDPGPDAGTAFPPPPEYGSTVKRAARFFGKENRRIPLPLVEFSRTRVLTAGRNLLIRPKYPFIGQ